MTNLASTAPKEEAQPQATQSDSVQVGKKEDQPQPPKAKWLFMNYIAADCNLEPFQVRNIDNQELVGSDPTTHIIAQIDRGPNPSEIDGGWTNCRRYYVTHDEQPDVLGSKVIEDMGRIDMSNPKTLTDFIVWAQKNYPAEHVALVLNDHGGGFTGAMADDSDGNFMSVPDLAKAIADAEAITGKKIDIVGFDACLMAEHEVAHELKNNANILLSSEESEAGPGWTYNPMLGGKTMNEAIQQMKMMKIEGTPEEFAKIVVDVNKDHNHDISTFSAIDLRKLDTLTTATDKLAEAIIASKDKTAIKTAIRSAESYGGGYTPYKDLKDEFDMAEKMSKSSGISDKAVKKAAQEVMDAVNTVVMANESNPSSHPRSHGVSIYTPTTTGASGPGYGYAKLAFAKNTKWAEALKTLGKLEASGMEEKEQPDIWPDGSLRKQKE
jgi:clostripain